MAMHIFDHCSTPREQRFSLFMQIDTRLSHSNSPSPILRCRCRKAFEVHEPCYCSATNSRSRERPRRCTTDYPALLFSASLPIQCPAVFQLSNPCVCILGFVVIRLPACMCSSRSSHQLLVDGGVCCMCVSSCVCAQTAGGFVSD
jgi:hypothetical protein